MPSKVSIIVCALSPVWACNRPYNQLGKKHGVYNLVWHKLEMIWKLHNNLWIYDYFDYDDYIHYQREDTSLGKASGEEVPRGRTHHEVKPPA